MNYHLLSFSNSVFGILKISRNFERISLFNRTLNALIYLFKYIIWLLKCSKHRPPRSLKKCATSKFSARKKSCQLRKNSIPSPVNSGNPRHTWIVIKAALFVFRSKKKKETILLGQFFPAQRSFRHLRHENLTCKLSIPRSLNSFSKVRSRCPNISFSLPVHITPKFQRNTYI